MDRSRAMVASLAGALAAVAGLLLAPVFLVGGAFEGIGSHGPLTVVSAAQSAAARTLGFAGVLCLLAGCTAIVGLRGRKPIPLLAATAMLATAAGLEILVLSGLQAVLGYVADQPHFLGMAALIGALLAITAAWLMPGAGSRLAVATLAAAAASAALVLWFAHMNSMALSDAIRADRTAWCPHLAPAFVAQIEASLQEPDRRLHAPRVVQSASDQTYWYVVADVVGPDEKASASNYMWLIEASGNPITGPSDPAAPIYAANSLAAAVSDLPEKLGNGADMGRIAECKRRIR